MLHFIPLNNIILLSKRWILVGELLNKGKINKAQGWILVGELLNKGKINKAQRWK